MRSRPLRADKSQDKARGSRHRAVLPHATPIVQPGRSRMAALGIVIARQRRVRRIGGRIGGSRCRCCDDLRHRRRIGIVGCRAAAAAAQHQKHDHRPTPSHSRFPLTQALFLCAPEWAMQPPPSRDDCCSGAPPQRPSGGPKRRKFHVPAGQKPFRTIKGDQGRASTHEPQYIVRRDKGEEAFSSPRR
jgi:hypothetical protein